MTRVPHPQRRPRDRISGFRNPVIRRYAPAAGEALPILAPDKEWTRNGTLHQRWDINFDAPEYLFQVDCLYAGTKRYLRMALPGVKQCVATIAQQTKIVSFQCK